MTTWSWSSAVWIISASNVFNISKELKKKLIIWEEKFRRGVGTCVRTSLVSLQFCNWEGWEIYEKRSNQVTLRQVFVRSVWQMEGKKLKKKKSMQNKYYIIQVFGKEKLMFLRVYLWCAALRMKRRLWTLELNR